MSLTLDPVLLNRWRHGDLTVNAVTGDARPAMEVAVRAGYLRRNRRADGWWTADWTPTSDYKVLPGVSRCLLEQSFDSNGITTATLDIDNIAYPAVTGVLGTYHQTQRGWFSPFRSYTSRAYPGLGVAPNEWSGVLATAAQIRVRQGYGDRLVETFTGLIDSVNAQDAPNTLTVVARDFGQLLTDCHIFGWNKEPNWRDPIHIIGEDEVKRMERSPYPEQRKLAAGYRHKGWLIIDDLSEVVKAALIWAGLQDFTVKKVGTGIKDSVGFGRGQYLIDIIKKAQDVTGYTFFMGEPTDAFPLGRPFFRQSNIVSLPAPVVELRDDQLLTGLNWQRSDENLASIIRVRGKPAARDRGGTRLGGDTNRRIMAVYRPPWHGVGYGDRPDNLAHPRDARLIRHVIHYEPLYGHQQECMVAAVMIGLQEALSSVTATIEIPAHPGLQLDDIVSIRDHTTGVASRAWIAQKQATFTGGPNASWKQSLGVSLLDTQDVVECIEDLHYTLNHPLVDELPLNQAAGAGSIPV